MLPSYCNAWKPLNNVCFSHKIYRQIFFSGAAAADVIFTLSSFSNNKTADVAKGSPTGCKFFNLYIFSKQDLVIELVRDAERNGYQALVVTIDSPLPGPASGRRQEMHKQIVLRTPFE